MDKYNLKILGNISTINIDTQIETKDSIEYMTLNFTSKDKIIFPKRTLKLSVPAIDIHYKWNSKIHLLKALNLDWFNNLHIVNILFSVPQISLLIDTLPKHHYNMLKFYCDLWNKYRDAFINGTFAPLNPFNRYNVLSGVYDDTFVCSYHSNEVINLDTLHETMVFVNGSSSLDLHLNIKDNCSSVNKHISIYSCEGEILFSDNVLLSNGYNHFTVPSCGVIIFN